MDAIPIDQLIDDLLKDKEIQVPSSITDPFLREVYKNEVMVLRSAVKRMSARPSPDWISGIYIGMETFARRIQEVQKAGLEAVYKSNTKP